MSASIVGSPLAFTGTGPISITLESAPAEGDLIVVLYQTWLDGGAHARTPVAPFQQAATLGVALATEIPYPTIGAVGCTYDAAQGLSLDVLADPDSGDEPWNAIVYVITGQAGEDFVTALDQAPANVGLQFVVPLDTDIGYNWLSPTYPSSANAIVLSMFGALNVYSTPLLDSVEGQVSPWIQAPPSVLDNGGTPDQLDALYAASYTLADDEPWNNFGASYLFDDNSPFTYTGEGAVPIIAMAYLVIAASDPAPYETTASDTPPPPPALVGGNDYPGTGDPAGAFGSVDYAPTPGNVVVAVLAYQNPTGDDFTMAQSPPSGTGSLWQALPLVIGQQSPLALGAWKVWQDGDAWGAPFWDGSGTPSDDISWVLVVMEFSGADPTAPIINSLPDCALLTSPESSDDPQSYSFSGLIEPRFAGPLYVGIVFGGEDPATDTGGLAINGDWEALGNFSGNTTSTDNAPTALMTISFSTDADGVDTLNKTFDGTSKTMAGAIALGFAIYAPVSLGAVPPPPITYELVITPDPATVPMGSIQQFVATKVGSDGTHTHPEVTWSTNAGTIDSDGNYTPLTSAIGSGYVQEGTGVFIPYVVTATEVD
jgi:hypothetical protein